MKKLFMLSTVFLYTALMFCGCEPLEYAFGVDNPEQYSKVYMPLSINGTMSYNLAIDEAEEVDVEIYANIGGLVKTKGDLAVTFRIEKDSLDVYNTRNNTEYALLPDDSYEFTDSIVTIPAGKTCSSSAARVSIRASKLQEGRYLLPVKLISVEGGDYAINQDRDILYIMVDAVMRYNSVDYPENYPLVYATSSIAGEITPVFGIPMETTVEVNANIGGAEPPAEDVTVTFAVDESYISEYNEETQSAYRLLPEYAYEIGGDLSVTIPAGSYVSEALSVAISSENLIGGPFILPLRIVSVGGEKYEINRSNSLIALRVKMNYIYCEGREGWTMECPNTEPSQGAAENLFDSQYGTFWCTKWKDSKPAPPHVLTLDLGATHEIHGLAFGARCDVDAGGNVTKVRDGMVHRCEVSVSYDNSSWISAGEYELSAATLQKVDSDLFFEHAFYGRYVRINVTSCYYDNGSTGFYQCGISELNIYGQKGEDENRKAVLTLSVSSEEMISIRSSDDIYDRVVKIKAMSDIPVLTDEQVVFSLDPAYVQEYNNANGTKCSLLEEGAYSADRLTVTIPSGAKESEELTLTVRPSAMSFGQFILPFAATSSSDFFLDHDDLRAAIHLVYSVNFDRTGWTAESSRTESTLSDSEKNLFDGDISTYWCTQWSNNNKPNPPHELIITMDQLKTVNGIAFAARVNLENGAVSRIRDGVIKACEISFSNDGQEWTSAEEFSLPYVTNDDIENRIFFDTPHEGKYIKVKITKCYKEGGTQEFYQCQLSEINVF